MSAPKALHFTKTHEWIRLDGQIATVGITDFAQEQLSDLTFVELPAIGDVFSAQDEVAVVESVKAASDVYAPVAGTVCEVNEQLIDHPELINAHPYSGGWIFKMKVEDPSDVSGLMDAEEYEAQLPEDEEEE